MCIGVGSYADVIITNFLLYNSHAMPLKRKPLIIEWRKSTWILGWLTYQLGTHWIFLFLCMQLWCFCTNIYIHRTNIATPVRHWDNILEKIYIYLNIIILWTNNIFLHKTVITRSFESILPKRILTSICYCSFAWTTLL